MSYDISLCDPVTKETLEVDEKHHIRGGTYQVGGTTELCLNVTYNYAPWYYEHIDKENGIRWLYEKTGAECIPRLKQAIQAITEAKQPPHDAEKHLAKGDPENYWTPTAENAARALCGLLALAQLRPDGVFTGD